MCRKILPITQEKLSDMEELDNDYSEDASTLQTLKQLTDEWLMVRSQLKRQSEKKKALDAQLKPKAKEQTVLKTQCKQLEGDIIKHMKANDIGTCNLTASKKGTLVVSTTTKRKTLTKEHWHAGVEQFLQGNNLDFTLEDVLYYVREQQEIVEKTELKLI